MKKNIKVKAHINRNEAYSYFLSDYNSTRISSDYIHRGNYIAFVENVSIEQFLQDDYIVTYETLYCKN